MNVRRVKDDSDSDVEPVGVQKVSNNTLERLRHERLMREAAEKARTEAVIRKVCCIVAGFLQLCSLAGKRPQGSNATTRSAREASQVQFAIQSGDRAAERAA